MEERCKLARISVDKNRAGADKLDLVIAQKLQHGRFALQRAYLARTTPRWRMILLARWDGKVISKVIPRRNNDGPQPALLSRQNARRCAGRACCSAIFKRRKVTWP
jgi:hypothetical protein